MIPYPSPDTDYRRRMRDMFLGPVSMQGPREEFGGLARVRLSRWSIGLAAAAAAALLIVLLLPRPLPVWQVADATPGAMLQIDGTSMPARDLLGIPLAPGTRIRGHDEGDVILQVDNAILLLLTPGTEITVGAANPRLGRPRLTATLHHGMAFGTTASGFPSGGLRMLTPEAEVHVSGTTFAVECNPDTTCVCVLTGTVGVRSLDGDSIGEVPRGAQMFVSRDLSLTRVEPLPSDRYDMLAEFHSRADGLQ